MSEVVENDYFEEQIDAVRLAKKLSNIQAFVDAPIETKQKSLQFLSGLIYRAPKLNG